MPSWPSASPRSTSPPALRKSWSMAPPCDWKTYDRSAPVSKAGASRLWEGKLRSLSNCERRNALRGSLIAGAIAELFVVGGLTGYCVATGFLSIVVGMAIRPRYVDRTAASPHLPAQSTFWWRHPTWQLFQVIGFAAWIGLLVWITYVMSVVT